MSPMRAPELLAERYKFARSIQAGSSTLAWLATDQRYGRQVVACALGEVRLKALERAVTVEHTYLATLLDLIRDPAPEAIPGDEPMKVPAVAIAEYVPGLALHDQVREGPLPPAEAVTMVARAAEALQALHTAGAVHGAVSPRSLIVAPSVARPAPVLVQLVVPASGAYSTPERLEGGGPTPENDVWALYATLYAALTGAQAFEGASKEELARAMREQRRKSLADCGVDRPELEALIADGLTASLERRRTSVADLILGLSTWQKNRDASTAEAAELARLSMDWEGDEPPGGEKEGSSKPEESPKPPTTSVEYAMFDDDAAEDQTTVFLRPAALLELRASAESAAESTNGVFEPPQAAPADEPPPDAPAPALPPPLPERQREPTTEKPRHPNKRGASEEAALEVLRSEAPPLDNEAAPVIPMFPLDMLYASKPESAPESAGDATPGPATEPPATALRRDTGMASRAPPKPKQPSIAPAAEGAMRLLPPKIEVSSSPRRDSRPWQDLTQPSRIRIAERAKAARTAAKAQPAAEPQGNPWVWIAGILGALTLVGIAALELERRSVRPPPVVSHEPVPPPAASTATTVDAAPASSTPPDAAPSAPAAVTDAAADALATNPLAACVASYFPSGTFSGAEELAFLCGSADFRGITSQLHRSLVKAGAGQVTEGMREWATLGWYELGAAAMVRVRCCPNAAPIDLPKYSSRCEALPEALAATAREPLTPADVAPRAQALNATIRCLYLNGVPRPYHYGIQPSGANRLVFEGFLARAAARQH